MTLGLRARIILIAAAVNVVAIAAITLAAGVDLADDYARAFQGRSLAVAKSLRTQLDRLLQYGIDIQELTGFEEQCREAVRTYEATRSAFVVSPRGKILFHNDASRMGQPVDGGAALAQAVRLPFPAVVRAVHRGSENFATVEPVLGKGGEHLASIVVSVPVKHVTSEIKQLALYGAAVGTGVLAFSFLALFGVLSRFVVRPLQNLLSAVDAIGRRADFSARVPARGAAEIRTLIEAFNRMLEQIQTRDAKLVSMERLARSEASLAYAQRLARVGNWEWQPSGEAAYWSPEVFRILDLEPDATPVFDSFLLRVPADERAQCLAAFQALLRGERQDLEHRIVARDGTERIIYQQAETVREAGRVVAVRGTLQDITERKQIERQMRTLAYYDSLTGLPNRTLFKQQLERALRKAARDHGSLAVMFLDLDRFKQINDSLGHTVGDALLREVGARLAASLRADDDLGRPANDTTARLGGDEFTVLLPALESPEDAAKAAARVVEAMARPFSVEGHELFVTASVGIATYPIDGEDVETLLKNADIAMYSAKEQGRNGYRFYSRELNSRALERLALERDLHRALERGELFLEYQPILDVRSGVCGVEALVRWRHPERGVVAPAAFIPVAEQSGLIVRIGEWVLGEACRQARAWCDAGLRLEVSVNVSGLQFRDGGLGRSVAAALERSRLDPALLVVEATETMMLQDATGTMAALGELKRLGVRIAIDDFGTGYSSFSYLKRFPVDTLKIDRSFVRDLDADNGDHAIVRAIVAMARNLGLCTLAEGVETVAQAELLAEVGCERMQGFLYARPVPAAEIPRLAATLRVARGPAREAPRLKSVG